MSRNRSHRHKGSQWTAPRGLHATSPRPSDQPRHATWATQYFIQNAIETAPGASFIYFIQEVDGGPVKIGNALDPLKRVSELQCGNPKLLIIRAAILAPITVEATLHQAFREARISGEWFGAGTENAILTLGAAIEDAQRLHVSKPADTRQVMEIAAVMLSEYLHDRERAA